MPVERITCRLGPDASASGARLGMNTSIVTTLTKLARSLPGVMTLPGKC